MAGALSISDGEAQYALAASRLTGDRIASDDQFAVRLQIWKSKGRWRSSGSGGTVVRIPGNFAGPRQLGMLTADFGQGAPSPVQVITDNRCGIVSREEMTIPRLPLPASLPNRLRFIYGVWTEPDGASVLFSRDYAPMWRLRDGALPQLVDPTAWIEHTQEEWFWDDADAPWDDPRRTAKEEAPLTSYGIVGLPLLVDVLPLQVTSVGNVPSVGRLIGQLRLCSPRPVEQNRETRSSAAAYPAAAGGKLNQPSPPKLLEFATCSKRFNNSEPCNIPYRV
ncbi:hypothetical protein [Rhodopseudomonas sp.]|uniref:hypothetical protein n=1 Tax=Rhodopseudomonas sp. TaxID=1078 RepID=UPI0039E47BD9